MGGGRLGDPPLLLLMVKKENSGDELLRVDADGPDALKSGERSRPLDLAALGV